MVLKDGKPALRQINVVTRQKRIVDTMLSEVNEVVANLEDEVRQSIENEILEKKVKFSSDDERKKFVDKFVDMRLNRFGETGTEYPYNAWQYELDKRVGDKLQEIRDLRKDRK